MMEDRIFEVTENGFSMTDKTVKIPACKIKAANFVDAIDKLNQILATRVKPDDIELVTPLERINFDDKKVKYED